MAHQTQLKKAKYRNWVKGTLSMKYLRDGLKKFTDDVVQKEHTRIIQQIGMKTGLNCTGCSLRDLKPVHSSVFDSTRRKSCPRGQINCNCLYPNKRSCPKKICDAIYEEILNTHASSPPSPFLKNTDITKWATHPWEIAKCFINAPGYKDKQTVEEIDVAGLLHIFINNKMYQTCMSYTISGNLYKARDLRNKIYHSPNLELEEQDLNECFENIVTILEDGKSLRQNQCAKEAVKQIKQLQNQDFIITTETEAMVLRDIVERWVNNLEAKQNDLENRQSGLEQKHSELAKEHSQLEEGHTELENRQSGLEQKHSDLAKKHSQLEEGHTELENRQSGLEQKHSELAKEHSQLEEGHTELENRLSGLEQKHSELAKEHSQLEEGHTELENRQSGLEQKHSELAKEHSQLEEGHPELENRQSGLEQKHTELDQRLVRVESKVDKLKGLHKNQLTIVEKRLDARRKLADHLQKHYVKTSASPLKTRQNEIDIDKVYVQPKIEIVKNKSSENNKYKNSSNNKPTFVETYNSIFHSHGKRLRRIYLLGELGSGKSAFCKMMILNWCRSVTKQTDQANCKDELENIEVMKQFDFLFFLPLRRLQGNGKIREMIHWYYKDLIPVEIMDDILLNVPEKCVILADGLDEWAPNHGEQRPLHVSDGLPYLEDIEEVTVLTTSRPSAEGVLNMTFTELDQKLVVKGIHSIDLMAENYIKLLKGPKRDSKPILDSLRDIANDEIEKSPLLLQQLVWMLGNGIEVGKCMSNVYSSLVNIALKWAEEKVSKKKIKNESSCQDLSELQLPKQLVKYDACRLNRNMLFILGKIAFELLVPENNCDSQMSFGRVKLNEDGIDDEMIDTLLSIGLLAEDNCHDNIEHRTQFAFVHASFQEYFAALYIASHPKTEQNQSPDAPNRPAREIILQQLFRRFCSFQSIVQLGVVLQILCGLAPDIIYDVCDHVYKIAQHDSEYSSLRDTYLLKQSVIYDLLEDRDKYVRITLSIQTLIANCIMECNFNAETSLHVSRLPILDLAIVSYNLDQYSGLFQYISPQTVMHLSLCSASYEGDLKSFISNVVFQNLQTIAIDWFDERDLNLFAAALNQHLLKKLSVRKCKILSFPSNEHVFDLSGHHQLELLNTNCNVVNVDLTNITVIKFANRNTSPITLGVAPKLRHLEVCEVRMLKREFIEFAKFISQNVSVQVIKLKNITIDDSVDKSLINLSSHDNLQVLEFISCINISIKSVNTTNLHTVTTDRIGVLHAVRNAQKLINLSFEASFIHGFTYTKEMNEDICSCSQLQEIELTSVTIKNEAPEMSCSMKNVKCIKLFWVMISLPAWIRFVDSLLNLKQSVTVRVEFRHLGESIDKVFSYIKRNNKKFNLKSDGVIWHVFEFETLP